MSHISSTIKRYTDTDYSKSYGGYSSYASNHSSSFSDRNKLSYKTNVNSSYYTSNPLRSYGDLDRSLPPLDSSTKRSDILGRSTSKYTPNAYSYGYNSSYSTFQTSPITSLSRKKSSSHTDLSLGFSELRTSDTLYSHSPGLTRSRYDLDGTSRMSRASNHMEFGDVYGKKRGSTNGYGLSCAAASEPTTSLAKPTSRFAYSYDKNEGSSSKETQVSVITLWLVYV